MAQQDKSLQVAEILSDLVSLRVCDRNAALALVSARPSQSPASKSEAPPASTAQGDQDVDLNRAKALLELHYGVREAHKRGELSRGLEEARRAVDSVVGR